MPSGCIGLEWCAERLTEVQAGRLASGMPNKASLYVDALDTVGRGAGICRTTRHSRPAMAATSDPEGLFLGRKLLRESPEEVLPLDLLLEKAYSCKKGVWPAGVGLPSCLC